MNPKSVLPGKHYTYKHNQFEALVFYSGRLSDVMSNEHSKTKFYRQRHKFQIVDVLAGHWYSSKREAVTLTKKQIFDNIYEEPIYVETIADL